MDPYAARKDKHAALIRLYDMSTGALAPITSQKSITVEASIVGTDIIIDKLMLLSLQKPSILAPVIVFPERDVPGISASACQRPIKKASFAVHSISFRFTAPKRSAKYKISPKKTIPNATTFGERIESIRPDSFRKRPNNSTGIVAIIINWQKLES